MNFKSSAAALISLFYLFTLAQATSPLDVDIGLYQLASHQKAEECTSVKIPWNLCVACKLRPFNGTGPNLDFGGVNRFDIYQVNNTWCRTKLKQYVDNNPCDTKRATTIKNLDSDKPWQAMNAYKQLIYFMYSVCETCCDCIPIGSREDSYAEQKANNTVVHVARGNCAAHMHYDTCRIWPNAGEFLWLKGTPSNTTTPWCPDFKWWQLESNFSRGWLRNNDVDGLTDNMKRGMNELMKRTLCGRNPGLWKDCVRMERAQFRV